MKNFRCYQEKEIDLGEIGLTLLMGQSGAGKSTILMAIYFCLYGEGTKIVSHTKTSCEVKIINENLIIRRTKRPNRLLVKDTFSDEEYEDDVGQSVIDKIFGKHFITVSYLQQNAYNSFILMNPSEKLNFIENFNFSNIDIHDIKLKIQNLIKEKNEILISVSSKLQISEEYFKTIVKPVKINYPLKTKNIELSSKNERTKLKNTKILLKRTNKKIEQLNDEYNNLKISNIKIQYVNTLIENDENRLKYIQSCKNDINYIGDDNLKSLEDNLKNFLKSKEYFNIEKNYQENLDKYNSSLIIEKDEMEKVIEQLDSSLWKEYTRDDLENSIEFYTKMLEDVKNIEKLSKSTITNEESELKFKLEEVEKYKQNIELLKNKLSTLEFQKDIYTCPCCNTNLKFENKKLYVFSGKINSDIYEIDKVKTDILDMSKRMMKLENTITTLRNTIFEFKKSQDLLNDIKSKYEEIENEKTILDTLAYLTKYFNENINNEKKLLKLRESLKNEKFSSILLKMKNDLDKQKEKLNSYKDIFSENINEEKVRNDIVLEKQFKQKLYDLFQEENKLTTSIEQNNTILERLFENIKSKDGNIRDCKSIEKEISDTKLELEKYDKDIIQVEENIVKIEQYEKYIQEYKIYKEWNDKVNILKKDEEKAKKDYAASTLLKEKVLQAESISITNIVNSINTHAQEYLNIFFPNEPITVRLVAFKETKKSIKPQINIEIDYKGMEIDINTLSGGELSRLVLAYTLALSEIFNSKIILLDECTSSLDQELTTTVIEGIKSNFPDKLIIIIAHQVVSGIFDKEINM
jgi:DNA repair exonuclease SbcCD ATPase subunit